MVPTHPVGENAFSLFMRFGDASKSRKAVMKVSKATSDEVRGVVITHLKEQAAANHFTQDAIQFYAGKAKEVQMKHYTALQSDTFLSFLDGQLGLD
jgi:hypothetical protein